LLESLSGLTISAQDLLSNGINIFYFEDFVNLAIRSIVEDFLGLDFRKPEEILG
jgi:hypothetical protein